MPGIRNSRSGVSHLYRRLLSSTNLRTCSRKGTRLRQPVPVEGMRQTTVIDRGSGFHNVRTNEKQGGVPAGHRSEFFRSLTGAIGRPNHIGAGLQVYLDITYPSVVFFFVLSQTSRARPSQQPLCSPSLPNCPSSKPLRMILIQMPRGCAVESPNVPASKPAKRLTSLESALPKNAPVTPLQSADPKTKDLKSFRIRRSEKGWVEGANC
jgi:hypothetical protein